MNWAAIRIPTFTTFIGNTKTSGQQAILASKLYTEWYKTKLSNRNALCKI